MHYIMFMYNIPTYAKKLKRKDLKTSRSPDTTFQNQVGINSCIICKLKTQVKNVQNLSLPMEKIFSNFHASTRLGSGYRQKIIRVSCELSYLRHEHYPTDMKYTFYLFMCIIVCSY